MNIEQKFRPGEQKVRQPSRNSFHYNEPGKQCKRGLYEYSPGVIYTLPRRRTVKFPRDSSISILPLPPRETYSPHQRKESPTQGIYSNFNNIDARLLWIFIESRWGFRYNNAPRVYIVRKIANDRCHAATFKILGSANALKWRKEKKNCVKFRWNEGVFYCHFLTGRSQTKKSVKAIFPAFPPVVNAYYKNSTDASPLCKNIQRSEHNIQPFHRSGQYHREFSLTLPSIHYVRYYLQENIHNHACCNNILIIM